MKTTKVDFFGHYDSSVSDTFKLELPVTNIVWKLTVDYIRIILPNDESYTEPTAYLQITSGMNTTACLHQDGKKPKGSTIMSIIAPHDTPIIRCYIHGIYGGPDTLRFAILDKDLKPVTIDRLVISFHFEEQK